MTYFIDPEIYKKYRDAVIALSQSIQINYPENLSPEKRPGLSDEQIAAELGIELMSQGKFVALLSGNSTPWMNGKSSNFQRACVQRVR